MKNSTKKLFLPLCAMLSLAVIIGAWGMTYALRGNGTYELKHIEGDPDLLNGWDIGVVYQDYAHEQHVRVKNGEISHSYLGYPNLPDYTVTTSNSYFEREDANANVIVTREPSQHNTNSERDVMRRTTDELRVEVSLHLSMEDTDGSAINRYAWLNEFKTGITFTDPDNWHEFQWVREPVPADINSSEPYYSSQQHVYSKGAASNEATVLSGIYDGGQNHGALDDEYVYFTPLVLPDFAGESAIYRIKLSDILKGSMSSRSIPITYEKDGYSFTSWTTYANDPEQAKIETIATIPLTGSSVKTLRLDMANDKLCLLLVRDNMLTLEIYEKDGKALNSIELFEIEDDYISTRISRFINVGMFASPQGAPANACYLLSFSQTGGYSYTNEHGELVTEDEILYESELRNSELFCVSIADDNSLALESRATGVGDGILRHAAYSGGQWLLIEDGWYHLGGNVGGISMSGLTWLRLLDKNGDVLYKGELVTDAMEDKIPNYVPGQTAAYMEGNFVVNGGNGFSFTRQQVRFEAKRLTEGA